MNGLKFVNKTYRLIGALGLFVSLQAHALQSFTLDTFTYIENPEGNLQQNFEAHCSHMITEINASLAGYASVSGGVTWEKRTNGSLVPITMTTGTCDASLSSNDASLSFSEKMSQVIKKSDTKDYLEACEQLKTSLDDEEQTIYSRVIKKGGFLFFKSSSCYVKSIEING